MPRLSNEHLSYHPLPHRARLSDTAVILTETFLEPSPSCVGPLACSNADLPPSSIPFTHLLWAERVAGDVLTPAQVALTYATTEASPRPATCVVTLDVAQLAPDSAPVETQLLERAYQHRVWEQRVLVIVNPHGGKGNATDVYRTQCAPLLAAARVEVEVVTSTHHGHATELIQKLALHDYDVILCASGDGIPHEVINGMRLRPDFTDAFNRWTVAQLPCGSGNAMAASCFGTVRAAEATLAFLKAVPERADLMSVTQEGRPPQLSFLSQTYGVIACADICTEFIRFMGAIRFDLGVVYQVFSRSRFPCSLAVKYAQATKDGVAEAYKTHRGRGFPTGKPREAFKQGPLASVTEAAFRLKYPDVTAALPSDWTTLDSDMTANLGIFYSGKMPYISDGVHFFPTALPNDGTIDVVVTDSRDSVVKTASYLTSIDSGAHFEYPEVHYSKVEAYRLTPHRTDSVLSIDGENFPLETVQVEILKGILKTALTVSL